MFVKQKQTTHLGMVNIPPIKNGDDWGMVYIFLFYPHYVFNGPKTCGYKLIKMNQRAFERNDRTRRE